MTPQQEQPPTLRRTSYLLVTDFVRVEEWCRDVQALTGHTPYLVGSVNTSPTFRDVDLRLILPDAVFDRWWRDPIRVRLANQALSTWGQRETGLPIDFQVQRQTEANEQFPNGFRNPMGLRDWTQQRTSGVPPREVKCLLIWPTTGETCPDSLNLDELTGHLNAHGIRPPWEQQEQPPRTHIPSRTCWCIPREEPGGMLIHRRPRQPLEIDVPEYERAATPSPDALREALEAARLVAQWHGAMNSGLLDELDAELGDLQEKVRAALGATSPKRLDWKDGKPVPTRPDPVSPS